VNTHWIDRLSEYHDNEMSPADREACAAHLAQCPPCRTALDDIRELASLASADADVMPSNDLWPGILARIEPNAGVVRPFNTVKRRHISFTLPQLALAASLLIAVSSGVAYLAAGRMLTPRASSPAEGSGAVSGQTQIPIQAVAEPTIPPSPDVAPANFADAQFDRAVADLERILVEQRGELDPGTVMVIERNLAAIDAAIREARAALEADPANTYLNTYLAEARRRKLDLLRRAATLNSAGD
jgi:hypothetical protein